MSNINICQSCSMPMEKPELKGTNKNGSKNDEYCIYCYQDGAFIKPNMTLDEMKKLVKEQMSRMKLNDHLVTRALNALPHLKRWKVEAAVQ
jgi:hypothetical protein